MKSSARNKKTVLRALRIPHELDEKIQTASVASSVSYSACLIHLAGKGLEENLGKALTGTSGRERLIQEIASWRDEKSHDQ